MEFIKMLFMFSALVTLVFSFPTGIESGNSTDIAQYASDASDSMENRKPIMLLLEEKNPNAESVVIEFVYNGNSGNSIASTATDKDKYSIDSQKQEGNDKTKYLKQKVTLKSTETNTEQKNHGKPTGSVTSLSTTENVKVMEVMGRQSLIPEEMSQISEKYPRYFYDIFNPIQPFPELQNERLNQMSTQKLQSEIVDAYLPIYSKEQRKSIDTAGPQLNPLSVYDRYFTQRIFD